MKKALCILVIALILIPFVSAAKNISPLPKFEENISWENLLMALENPEEYSNAVRLIKTKLEQTVEDNELSRLSWELIHSALEKTENISLFEKIIAEKWRQIEYGNLIQIAGNEDDDRIRLNYLKRLLYISKQENYKIPGLEEINAAIEQWINPKEGLGGGEGSLSYFHREISRTMDYDLKVGSDSPLYPIACIYRAHMLVRSTLQSGSIISYLDKRRKFLGKAQKLYKLARAAFPENRVVRMYMGEPYPPVKEYPAVEEAPEWAAYQREGLERLADVIEWLIDNRMREDGSFGGGWGDDCEMWRNWVPVLIGFDDPKITWAQSRFSRALLSQPHLEGGYMNNRLIDVEHSAEDNSDALTPMMHLEPDNPEWKKRVLLLVDLMENLWTGINKRGFLQFKSTYFNAVKVETDHVKACDTAYHTKAVQPALLYWQRTGDKRLTKLFSTWMDTWVDAAARAERGKPAGVLPTAIQWPQGHIGGVGEEWWNPKNHPGEVTLYAFPSALSMMTMTLLQTYHMTGNSKYLEPIKSMAKIRLDYLKNKPRGLVPGTVEWCGSKIGFISNTIAKYRFLTGSTEFDDLLAQEKRHYIHYRLWSDKKSLVEGLKQNAEALRFNFPSSTSELRFTDRMFSFPRLFRASYMFDEDIPAMKRPNVGLLYNTATGDPGSLGLLPLNAVRWLTPPRNIAALVTKTGENKFTAELFHFGSLTRKMAAELYLLDNGKYAYTLLDKEGKQTDNGLFEVKGPRTRISFVLPPKKLYTLRIRRR